MKPFFDGIMTGMFLQLALGPVFFYILGITMDSNYIITLAAVSAVTLADYIYIILSLAGIGKLLEKENAKKIFQTVSSIILSLFGIMIIYKGLFFAANAGRAVSIEWTPLNSFTSCFILTISSPLTIVFWSGIFSAKAIEKNYKKKALVIFGAGTGASTFLFLSLTMLILSLLKSNIPHIMVQFLNCIVGLILIGYGITRLRNVRKDNRKD